MKWKNVKEYANRIVCRIPDKFYYFIMIALCVAIIGSLLCQKYVNQMQKQQQIYEDLKVSAVQELPDPEPDETGAAEPALKIDFSYLQEQNSDVYAWIDIPGMDISYPVLQNEEDNYYLLHNFDHSQGRPGCIYSNSPDAKDFADFVSILYGHDMNDGTMFGQLCNFYSEDFFDEHDTINIYTPSACLTYQIIKVREHSDEYIPHQYYYFSDVGKEAFIEMLEEPEEGIGHTREAASFEVSDRFLILSTCIKDSDNRYLIIGKLVREENY